MFKKIFYLIAVFCFATSCRNTRQVVRNKSVDKEVLREKIETFKDTVFVSNPISTTLKIPVVTLPDFKHSLNSIEKPFKAYTQTNGNATAKVVIKRDTIIVTATCDTLKFKAKIRESLLKETHNINTNIDHKEVVKKTSVLKLIAYSVLFFIVGFASGYFIKTLKII